MDGKVVLFGGHRFRLKNSRIEALKIGFKDLRIGKTVGLRSWTGGVDVPT
jgi:hypothetical protein